MIRHDHTSTVPRFTRGEKCIFFHLVLVFVATLILIIIFILHLYTVRHSNYSSVQTRRAAHTNNEDFNDINYPPLGAVLLNITPDVIICNCLLLKATWSVSPANCVNARSHPDMANWLMLWRIVYKHHNTFVTEIKRSIVHSHFDKDTLGNNIGVFEHVSDIPLDQYVLTNGVLWDSNYMKSLRIISTSKYTVGGDDIIQEYFASLFPLEKCAQYTALIMDIRNYEFCIVPHERSVTLEYGALVLSNEKIMGFFSWGERNMKHLPFVILNITYFHNWLNTMVSFV